MTKIRNFKVSLRENLIYRAALKQLGIPATPQPLRGSPLLPQGEKGKYSLMKDRALYEGLLSKMRSRLSPGTLFDTFPLAKLKGPLSACGAEAPANTVAASLVVASLGNPVEELFPSPSIPLPFPSPSGRGCPEGTGEGGGVGWGEGLGEGKGEVFLSEMAEDALEQSARFVSRILAREAEEEECELAAPLSIQSPEKILLDKKMKGFSLSKIGVTLNPEGVWKPRFSRAYVIFWIQKKKS